MSDERLRERIAPAHIDSDQFRVLGHALVDRISVFLSALPGEPIKSEHAAARITALLEEAIFPEQGSAAEQVLSEASDLLCQHAMSTSHPRFWAYIMGASSPMAILADFLAAAISAPMTSYATSALTVAMEAQTIQWMAQLVGYPAGCGGLFLSGGSIANLVALRLALFVKAGFDVRTEGLSSAAAGALCFYASSDAHSSIVAAAQICGLGTRALHEIALDAHGRMDTASLRRQINIDKAAGYKPFMVIAIAGTTTLGVVDPLPEIADICRSEDLWFHVDGAYGGFAALSPQAPSDILGLREADSLTIDPHKWLYMPADVGCFLTRDPKLLFATFQQGAPYYADNDEQALLGGPQVMQFRDLGPQTTRGFRALKVRLGLQFVGREGYQRMITDDILLARRLYEIAQGQPGLEALSHHLSITTFRYVPSDLTATKVDQESYLNALNQEILQCLHSRGVAYPSHTSLGNQFALRLCIVNYNTTLADIEALARLVLEIGTEIDRERRYRSVVVAI